MLRLVKKLKRIKRHISPFPYFAHSDVQVGKNVSFGTNIIFNCSRVRIGDGAILQSNITVDCDVFEIGDYSTIGRNCFFPGPGELRIGHNFWLGSSSIVDSQGNTTIGNNVGIGAGSQLWTHIAFGDVMFGSRFHGSKPLTIGDDVWLVGHCLVSPVNIESRSIAMLGSVITKDMKENHSYAGTPAVDLTDKIGSQFKDTSIKKRREYIQERLSSFSCKHKIENLERFVRIVENSDAMHFENKNIIYLNIADRTYTKRRTKLENKLIRFLLPDAKFIPILQHRVK